VEAVAALLVEEEEEEEQERKGDDWWRIPWVGGLGRVCSFRLLFFLLLLLSSFVSVSVPFHRSVSDRLPI
jgi:hypothetical protein